MRWQDLKEADAGDIYLAHQARDRELGVGYDRMPKTKGFWLIDAVSGKKLAGPFRNDVDAGRFKQNRPDRIDATAKIEYL